jgi:glutamyl-tRNA(Gln) amidotransferase subunit E
VDRARLASVGVPPEVRGALADGSTRYLRSISSAARMYPETDVLPLEIPEERFQKIVLPELPDEKARRYIRELDIGREQAKQIVGTEVDQSFESLVADFPTQSRFIARLLLGALPKLEGDGFHKEQVSLEMLRDITALHQDSRISRDSVFEILKYCVEKSVPVMSAFQELGLESPGEEKVLAAVTKVLRERSAFVKEKGRKAQGPLMGVVMKEMGGKANGKMVSEVLKREIRSFLGLER